MSSVSVRNTVRTGSILPEILEVAEKHGLLSSGYKIVPGRNDEIRVNCPFCGGDKTHHLYLNIVKQVFHCFKCGSNGGIVKFVSLLEGGTKTEILNEYIKNAHQGSQKRGKRNQHPATYLNIFQLQKIGYEVKPDWDGFFKEDFQNAMNFATEIWYKWRNHVNGETFSALVDLYIGIETENYPVTVENLQSNYRDSGFNVTKRAMEIYSSPEPPAYAKIAKEIASEGNTFSAYKYIAGKACAMEDWGMATTTAKAWLDDLAMQLRYKIQNLTY